MITTCKICKNQLPLTDMGQRIMVKGMCESCAESLINQLVEDLANAHIEAARLRLRDNNEGVKHKHDTEGEQPVDTGGL